MTLIHGVRILCWSLDPVILVTGYQQPNPLSWQMEPASRHAPLEANSSTSPARRRGDHARRHPARHHMPPQEGRREVSSMPISIPPPPSGIHRRADADAERRAQEYRKAQQAEDRRRREERERALAAESRRKASETSKRK